VAGKLAPGVAKFADIGLAVAVAVTDVTAEAAVGDIIVVAVDEVAAAVAVVSEDVEDPVVCAKHSEEKQTPTIATAALK
jgi:hypothetical protein